MNKITKLALLAAIILPLQFSTAQITINEVYGGGGNASAPFNQDFVELFNSGLTPFDISGFALQYSSAPAGAFNSFITFASGTFIPAGSTFLVSVGPTGANGVALPTVNGTGAAGTNLSATNGAVRLINIALTTVDLVGYGTSTNFEGLGAAPAGTNTTSIQRLVPGVDTNNNSVDFTTGAPTPLAAVPEPATYMLFGIGLLACAQRFRRSKKG